MAKIGYARVSTLDQNLDLQMQALRKAGCKKIFREKVSGRRERPEFQRMLEQLRKGDTVIVWKLDRLARNPEEAGIILGLLKRGEIKLIITSDGEYRPGALAPEMPTTLVGRRGDRMERARNFGDRADAVVDKTRNLITLEATDAYLRWEETSRKVAATRRSATAGTRLANHTREDFRADQKVKIEDVLTNEVLAGQARSSANEALYQYLLSLAALQRVTAGGFHAGLGKAAAE